MSGAAVRGQRTWRLLGHTPGYCGLLEDHPTAWFLVLSILSDPDLHSGAEPETQVMEWAQGGLGSKVGVPGRVGRTPHTHRPTPRGSCRQVLLSVDAQLASQLRSPPCKHLCSGVFLASWWPGLRE